ncbi:hypothetical protein B0J11DRAFT_514006 [Dendryphion nanum]|uniref:Mog1p/PsbP-like protein n=1 Tax=Dendryphion nanum TaxID=256645 RepID=A0A9P9J1T2_9PLEO|nr:hypothetical protein B0J11DRAFT_514006 [Dendryphion nanum]
MSFKSTPLYGGAIQADLPTNFHDASTIRQIPDHQEVYIDSNGYSSIVIDILEYVTKDTDEEALQYHFADLIDGTGDKTNVLEQSRADMGRTPNHPVYTLSFLQTPQSLNPRRKEPEFVAIHLLLLRLREKGTDIVITINIPHYAGEYEKAGETDGGVTPLMREGEKVAKRVLDSFEVREWGLFDA